MVNIKKGKEMWCMWLDKKQSKQLKEDLETIKELENEKSLTLDELTIINVCENRVNNTILEVYKGGLLKIK